MHRGKMNIEFQKVKEPRKIYDYMAKEVFPYNYKTEYNIWENSFLNDIDGNGNTLFSELEALGAYSGKGLVGFVQYGRTAFGFDDDGELSNAVSYPVIRSLYFDKGLIEVGNSLLNKAINALSNGESSRIYAFFHYFGMSCYARHGKLFEGFKYINDLLLKNGFSVEHKNVFYSSSINAEIISEVTLAPQSITQGNQQYFDFILDASTVGGCEVHFLEQGNIAYLRWIYVNENICNKGIGTKCMDALKSYLFCKGITKFDTDTAISNKVAQHFYEKNGFVYIGVTTSYYKALENRNTYVTL